MDEREILARSIQSIKEDLIEQKDEGVKTGLYFALSTIRNRIIMVNEDLLKELDLEEELEKYL